MTAMYTLLRGIRALEVSLLAPDMLGQHLADLGAEVIKVEEPPRGDYVRELGGDFIGGLSLMHLRWNRGKRSLALNLKTEAGRGIFVALAKRSHIVIDGLRAGALDRFGVGYEAVRAANPAIVYCALSGLGTSGPYRRLASHGALFDAYAGLAPPAYPTDDGIPRLPPNWFPVGTVAGGLFAAVGTLAALVRAVQSGEGAYIDVAQADAASAWRAEALARAANAVDRGPAQDLTHSVRYSYYRTADDRVVLFQASEAKFWNNFCRALGRTDLLERFPSKPVGDHASGNEELRRELQAIFRTRTQSDWVEFFLAHNIPGGPVHTMEELPEDPQFRAREMLYEADHPRGGHVQLVSTPIKVGGQTFGAAPAPEVGQDTEAVLRGILGLGDAEIGRLRAEGIIS